MGPLATRALLFFVMHVYLAPALLPVALGAAWLAGWPWLLAYGLVFAVYSFWAFDGSERRRGKLWPLYLRTLLRTHPYFPCTVKMWNGTAYTAQPEEAHSVVYGSGDRPLVMAVHPHGPLPATAAILLPELTRWGRLFSRVRFGVAWAIFKLPILRELHLWGGCVDASRRVLSRLLACGHSVAVLPDGMAEQLLPDDEPGVTTLVLAERRGFVRLALQHGAMLVPVFGFGERQLYKSFTLLSGMRDWVVRQYRVGLPVVHGRWCTMMPYRRPFLVVMGPPLDLPCVKEPDEATVHEWHQRYMAALTELHDQHAPRGSVLRIQ